MIDERQYHGHSTQGEDRRQSRPLGALGSCRLRLRLLSGQPARQFLLLFRISWIPTMPLPPPGAAAAARGWSVTALGPPGIDHLMVMVTDSPRDFSTLSLPAEYVSQTARSTRSGHDAGREQDRSIGDVVAGGRHLCLQWRRGVARLGRSARLLQCLRSRRSSASRKPTKTAARAVTHQDEGCPEVRMRIGRLGVRLEG